MKVDLFDYDLPRERIAQRAVEPRDASRLLILGRESGRLEHRHFRDLIELLRADDVLVLNDTRVIPARLFGVRTKTGGRWEGLYLRSFDDRWEMMTKTRGRPEPGETITVPGAEWTLTLVERTPEGSWLVKPSVAEMAEVLLSAVGHVPLPPYIRGGKDTEEDRSRYQTVYAGRAGAIAAPTAGLHFTPEMLDRLKEKGVLQERVTLHVGAGTFQPVTVEDVREHPMHSEWCEISAEAAGRIYQARQQGGRVIAVGTTVVRTLESAYQSLGQLDAFKGETKLLITPGYEFRAIDGMLTNFHLPRSTLLMLVSAFAGRERVLNAYREAIRLKYRFYSYGDAMLII